MTTMKELHDNLGYVASAIRRGEPRSAPSLFLLWAALVLPGFSLGDFAPQYLGAYCLIGGSIGGLASWWLSRRFDRSSGERDPVLKRRAWMSGLAVGVAFSMFGQIIADAHVPARGSLQLWLLLQGLVFTMLGVYHSKECLPAGMLMFVGCAVLFSIPEGFIWTSVGLIFSAAMLTGWLFTRNATQENAS